MGSKLEGAYFKAPVWVQNLAVSALGYQLRQRRFGELGLDFENYLGKTYGLDTQELATLQEKVFSELIQYCFKNIPYYRQLAAKEPSLLADPPGLQEISRLPIIEKEMIRKNPELFLADSSAYPGSTFSLGTSGTSGTPLKLYCDTPARQKHYAFWTRLRKQNNLLSQSSRATFFGRVIMSPDANSPPFWRFDRAQNNTLFSSYHLAEENLGAYYQKLCQLAPDEIIGYPSSLFQIARFIVRENLDFPAPQVVFTTAETLLPQQREALEKAFRAPVVDQYGCTEMVLFVAQCDQGGYHVHPEHGYLEILDDDGAPVPEGVVGSAVCTGFLNRAMPLIRYRLGDRLISGSGPCPCGSSFPLLNSIEGRLDDTLLAVDGRPLTRLDPVFKTLSGIAETQIIQEEKDLIVVKLVADESFNEAAEADLVNELRKRTGREMRLRIERVPDIPKGPNGKFRAVISKLS